MSVGIPAYLIILCLISPNRPVLARTSREYFQTGAGRARFNNAVKFIGLTTVLSLSRAEQIYLPTAWRQGSCILTADTKKAKLRYISKIESDAASI